MVHTSLPAFVQSGFGHWQLSGTELPTVVQAGNTQAVPAALGTCGGAHVSTGGAAHSPLFATSGGVHAATQLPFCMTLGEAHMQLFTGAPIAQFAGAPQMPVERLWSGGRQRHAELIVAPTAHAGGVSHPVAVLFSICGGVQVGGGGVTQY